MKSGERIGTYRVVEKLGEGGMGEVYRARDLTLGRDVALKVLPQIFAGDPERLARFEREARTLAGLNHAHIAQIHGFESFDGTRVLIMELVEGEDLAQRLTRGPLPLEEALAVAKQIAAALEAAHERGIVHRDLKPANIKVRDDGTVKVLDFGLAKALESSAAGGASGVGSPGEESINSPTITTPAMTIQGVILGTAAYMAPEQAKGKAVDKRADIWAFGAVLYEMITGRRAFAGDDVSDTLASVLRAEVDWTGVPRSTQRLLKKCLERDPKRRLHDIGDAWDLLDDQSQDIATGTARHHYLAWGTAALLLLTTIALGVVAVAHFRETPPAPELMRFEIPPPLKNAYDIYVSLSPDGRRLAFTTRDDTGVLQLWVRDFETLEPRLIGGVTDPSSLFWSPDSRYLAFGMGQALKRIDMVGGPAQTIAEAPTQVGTGAWGADDLILFGLRGGGPVLKAPAAGGTPTPVTVVEIARQETFHSFPQLMPDGKHFLFFRQSSNPEMQGIYAGAIDVAPEKQGATRIVPATMGNTAVVPSRTGHELLFYRDGTLFAQDFDVDRLQVGGSPRPVAERVGSSGSFAFFSASRTGTLVYRTGGSSASSAERLTWLDRKGVAVGTVGEPRPLAATPGALTIAPNATHAIVAIAPTPGADLWLLEFARGIATRLTFDTASDFAPVWSPDGKRFVFRSNRQGSGDLYIKDVDGTSDEKPLFTTPLPETPTDWSADGRYVLFNTVSPPTASDVSVLEVSGSAPGAPRPLLATSFAESGARFSPDGRWIAYTSNESGRSEIYIRPFIVDNNVTTVGAKWQVSTDGGGTPRWRRDGKELFYRHPNGAFMAADVSQQGTEIRTGIPRQLFVQPLSVINWDVAADGQRFLVSIPTAVTTSNPVTVVLNWQTR